MEPNAFESTPELPKPKSEPELAGSDTDGEVLKSPKERAESTMPGEALVRANDAVSQAIATTPLLDDASLADNVNQAVLAKLDENPPVADDVDVIEKEWVQKAKQIVSETKEDPHEQSKKINVFKHDYMKKRYGKEIKLPEEQKGT